MDVLVACRSILCVDLWPKMGNYLNTTTDHMSPLQIRCAKYPDEAKQFKQFNRSFESEIRE